MGYARAQCRVPEARDGALKERLELRIGNYV
jgi:hypothetical protein